MNTLYTQHDTERVAQRILDSLAPRSTAATIVGLSGELGAGKTTLVQSMAHILGVTDPVVSPTFVIAKIYATTHGRWRRLVHMDAYRIEGVEELDPLGWEHLSADKENLIVVEWPERIAEKMPPDTEQFVIDHRGSARYITHLSHEKSS